MSDSAIETAANALVDWALDQYRLRAIVERPFGIYDGKVQGELVYHAPRAMRPRPFKVKTGV